MHLEGYREYWMKEVSGTSEMRRFGWRATPDDVQYFQRRVGVEVLQVPEYIPVLSSDDVSQGKVEQA